MSVRCLFAIAACGGFLLQSAVRRIRVRPPDRHLGGRQALHLLRVPRFSGTQPWASAVGPVADNLYFAAPRMHAPTIVITSSVFSNVSTVGYSLGAHARGHGRCAGDGIVRASTGQSASWAHDA